MKSQFSIHKETVEMLKNKLETVVKTQPSTSECGIKKPCKFDIWNVNFNKHCLN